MNVIHYMIGFPPYRHGGASRYAIDLIKAQKEIGGMNVSILIPGDTFPSFRKYPWIKKRKPFDEIPVYSIENPIIEPLLYGIKDVSYILNGEKSFSTNNLDNYFTKVRPHVLHLHTLMGIPKSFILYMKTKGVKIVMTSHDYFGLCPKVNFLDINENCCECYDGSFCAECNQNSRSKWFLKICNSDIFLRYKHLLPVRAVNVSKNSISNSTVSRVKIASEKKESYKILLSYYLDFFANIDAIHFNSSVTKRVFEHFINIPFNSEIIPITTSFIKDRRKEKRFCNRNVKLGFIGGIGLYKGFPILKSVLIDLNNEGIDSFTLNVWEDGLYGQDNNCLNIFYKGKYGPNDLDNVFGKMDLLIVPSVWKETFSLVTMEALSFGVPVLLSSNVGAQDVIKDIFPSFIFDSKESLYVKLKEVLQSPSILQAYNLNIVRSNTLNLSENSHALQIVSWYKKVIAK